MMIIAIKIAASIVLGLLAGLSVVYVFNHMPARWLCDYNETPNEREAIVNKPGSLTDPYVKRIKENPWRWVYSAGFICLCLRLSLAEYIGGYLNVSPESVITSSQLAAAGLLFSWILMLIALSDMKYMIIPDQFVVVLALAGVGFAPVSGFREALIGFAIGGGFMLLCSLVGRLIFKQEAFGFGDVKLCAAIGLALGINGTVATVAGAVIISGFVAAAGLASGKFRKNQQKPLGPYICGCGIAYIMIVMPLLTLQNICL